MNFCVKKLSADPSLRPPHGVLRVAALRVTADAHQEAARLVAQARKKAEEMVGEAREEAARAVQLAEKQTLQRAEQLLLELEQAQAAVLSRVEEIVVDLAQAVFERLVAGTTARERVEAALQQVQREAPPRLLNVLLRVHPDDLDLLPAVEWTVKPDPTMARGACRLEASSGEWCANFEAAVSALQAALSG